MKTILKKVQDIIEEPMNKIDIVVCDINWVIEHKHHFLKITLDKSGGLDLDAIVEATNIINPLLDEYDLIEEEYILDISSKERG